MPLLAHSDYKEEDKEDATVLNGVPCTYAIYLHHLHTTNNATIIAKQY